MVIDKNMLDDLSAQAKASPRLRMNYNFHHSLDELCHRMLNALEPGTEVPIHHHPDKDETFVILRGKIRVTTYNDDGSVIDSVVLCLPRMFGTLWKHWSQTAASSNASRGRLCRMKRKGCW